MLDGEKMLLVLLCQNADEHSAPDGARVVLRFLSYGHFAPTGLLSELRSG